MGKTKIDWADRTWNPVTGCLHGCEYCYARKIATRFGNKYMPFGDNLNVLEEPFDGLIGIDSYPYGFEPTFHQYRLEEPSRIKKPQTIFVCSMADLFGEWVPNKWIEAVLIACEKAPQHRYLFLTKNFSRYKRDPVWFYNNVPTANKSWFGASMTGKETRDTMWGILIALTYCNNSFLSIEPLHREITFPEYYMPKWIIIGAETGNRKSKIIPKKEWVDSIVDQCQRRGAKVFMKESLRSIMGDDFIQEFPWEV